MIAKAAICVPAPTPFVANGYHDWRTPVFLHTDAGGEVHGRFLGPALCLMPLRPVLKRVGLECKALVDLDYISIVMTEVTSSI